MKTYIINRMKLIAVAALLASIATLGGTAGVTMAQGGPAPAAGQSTKGAVLKGKAPVNKSVLRVKLPKAQEATLANGLRVVLLENHKVPTYTMQMVVLSGGLSDKADYRGLASFT